MISSSEIKSPRSTKGYHHTKEDPIKLYCQAETLISCPIAVLFAISFRTKSPAVMSGICFEEKKVEKEGYGEEKRSIQTNSLQIRVAKVPFPLPGAPKNKIRFAIEAISAGAKRENEENGTPWKMAPLRPQ